MSILRPGITILRHLKPSTYIRPWAEKSFKREFTNGIQLSSPQETVDARQAVKDMWKEEGQAFKPDDRFFYNPVPHAANKYLKKASSGRIETMEEGVAIQYNHRIDRINTKDGLKDAKEEAAGIGRKKQQVDRTVQKVAARDERAKQLQELASIEKELEALRAQETKLKETVNYYQEYIDNKTYYTGLVNRAWGLFTDVEAVNNTKKKTAEAELRTCRSKIQQLQKQAAPIKKVLLKKAERAVARQEKLEAKFVAEEAERDAMTDAQKAAADELEAKKIEARAEERKKLREDMKASKLSPAEREQFKKEYYRNKALGLTAEADKAKIEEALAKGEGDKAKLEADKAELEAAIAKRDAAKAKRDAKQDAKLDLREDLREALKPLRDQLRANYPTKMTEAEQKQFAAEWEKIHSEFQAELKPTLTSLLNVLRNQIRAKYPPIMSKVQQEQFATEWQQTWQQTYRSLHASRNQIRAKYPPIMSKVQQEQFAAEWQQCCTAIQQRSGLTGRTQADARFDAYNAKLIEKGKTAKTKEEVKAEQEDHARATEAALKAPLSNELADRAKQLLQTTQINKASLLSEGLKKETIAPKKEEETDLQGLLHSAADAANAVTSGFGRKTKAAQKEALKTQRKNAELFIKKIEEKLKATETSDEEKAKLTKQLRAAKAKLKKAEINEKRQEALTNQDDIVEKAQKEIKDEFDQQKTQVAELKAEKRKQELEAAGMKQMRPTKAALGLGKEYLFVPLTPAKRTANPGKEGSWFPISYTDTRQLHVEIRDPNLPFNEKHALGQKLRRVAATVQHDAVKPAYLTHKAPGYKAAKMTELEAREAAMKGYKQLCNELNNNGPLAQRLKKLQNAHVYVTLEENGDVTVSTLDKHKHPNGRFKQTDALYTVAAKKNLSPYTYIKVDPKTKAKTKTNVKISHPLTAFTRGVEEAERWANLNLPTGWESPTRPSSSSSYSSSSYSNSSSSFGL